MTLLLLVWQLLNIGAAADLDYSVLLSILAGPTGPAKPENRLAFQTV
jgi:hypothetical protein